jgi:hypothetical protein
LILIKTLKALVGRRLMADMSVQMRDISHQNFQFAQQLIEQNGEAYFNASVQEIQRKPSGVHEELRVPEPR